MIDGTKQKHEPSPMPTYEKNSHDTRRCLGEENEESGGQEHRNDGATQLGNELVLGLCTEEITSLQVARHIGGLSGGASSNNTSSQIETLRRFGCQPSPLGDSSEDELRGFCDGRDGVDVCVSGGLHSDEGEDEAEEEGEDSLSDIHVEHSRKDRAAHDGAEEQSRGPPKSRNTICKRGLILLLHVKSLSPLEPVPRVQSRAAHAYGKLCWLQRCTREDT